MKNLLKKHERVQLEAAYKSATDKRTSSNINILLLLDDGYPYSQIAAILRIDDSTVRRHEHQFKEKGLEQYIKNPFVGGACKLDASQLQILEGHLDEILCETTDEVIKFTEEKFGITYTRSGMAALLKRLGFVFKKPVIVPGKHDPEMQSAFVD